MLLKEQLHSTVLIGGIIQNTSILADDLTAILETWKREVEAEKLGKEVKHVN